MCEVGTLRYLEGPPGYPRVPKLKKGKFCVVSGAEISRRSPSRDPSTVECPPGVSTRAPLGIIVKGDGEIVAWIGK